MYLFLLHIYINIYIYISMNLKYPKVYICICLQVENSRNKTAKQLYISESLRYGTHLFLEPKIAVVPCALGCTWLWWYNSSKLCFCTFAVVFLCTITMWYLRENIGGRASVGCDTFRHLESICWKCCAINRLCVLEAHADKIDSCCNVAKKYVLSADKVRQKQRPDAVP